ncbi:MAG TPA: vWA domain-containing protein [Bdellovibrio sp.]|uniref:vWA domain-containing protein n=1 Tax=Bdellovibrio sp. TaxID=28201 RepID=UPI002F0C6783
MRHILALSIYLGALALLAACSPESKGLQSQPVVEEQSQPEIPHYDPIASQKFDWIQEDGGQSQLDFNPQVDILFVTDNSDSMKSAQENLARNIDRFTESIVKNKMIDYHIGVVSCWDSTERYAKMNKEPFKVGDLRFVKDLNGRAINKRFFTKADATKDSLAKTLNIGVLAYNQGGPEIEEFFSPLSAALENTGHGATNEGFFRENAQLIVVIMTDADDSTSRVSPEEMAKTLVDFKGGKQDKVAVYGVLVNAKDPDSKKDWDLRIHPKYHPECFDMTGKTPKNNGKCTGFGPDRLEQFVVAANVNSGTPDQIRSKYIMDITSTDFGAGLAKMGNDITVKTLAKEIFLSQRPRVNDQGQLMVRVRYGTEKDLASGKAQVIPQKAIGGWLYDPENNSVHLSGDIKYNYQDGARFAVDLIPLTLKQ